MSTETKSKDFETVIQELAGFTPSREHAERLVIAFGARIGVADLRLDENGEASITVDGNLVVSINYYAHLAGLVLAAPLPMAAAEDETIMRHLLQANMSWPLTDGGTFAMAPGTGFPLLLRQIPLGSLDAAAMDRYVTDFVEVAHGWHREIETEAANAARLRAEQATAAPDPGSMV